MLPAASPAFIEPCLPSPADRPPSGSNWIHEIKHDRYRLMARRDPVGIRLITRRGNDWSSRFPLVVEAVNPLKVRSCRSHCSGMILGSSRLSIRAHPKNSRRWRACPENCAGNGNPIPATSERLSCGCYCELALMKIQTVLPDSGVHEKRRATVLVEFGKERMTIEVVVPADRDEDEVRELAVARARDFARRFVTNDPSP
jgi:hypothetical protein